MNSRGKFIEFQEHAAMDSVWISLIDSLLTSHEYQLIGRMAKVSRLLNQVVHKVLADHTITIRVGISTHTVLDVNHEMLHSVNDQPAYIDKYGMSMWYYMGYHQRPHDLPASAYDICQEWYHKGQRHRDGDLPAVIYQEGTREWWQCGMRHRDDQRPAIVRFNGTVAYWEFGVEIDSRLIEF